MAEMFEYFNERDWWYPESLIEGFKNYFVIAKEEAKAIYIIWRRQYVGMGGIN